jgi:hypothetical protein
MSTCTSTSTALALIPKQTGRPRTANEAQLKDSLCEMIANGDTRTEACQKLGLGYSTVGQWLTQDERFAVTYARSRVECSHQLAERALLIARERPRTMPEAAGQRAELDAIKWFTSKIAPRLYGERLITEHTHRVGVVLLPALPGEDTGKASIIPSP